MVPNLGVFIFFCEVLQLDKFEGADFKYDNSFSKFNPKNTQIRYFRYQISAFSFFHEMLQLDKFEGADFKYDNSSLKFEPKNTQMRHFCFFTKFFK